MPIKRGTLSIVLAPIHQIKAIRKQVVSSPFLYKFEQSSTEVSTGSIVLFLNNFLKEGRLSLS